MSAQKTKGQAGSISEEWWYAGHAVVIVVAGLLGWFASSQLKAWVRNRNLVDVLDFHVSDLITDVARGKARAIVGKALGVSGGPADAARVIATLEHDLRGHLAGAALRPAQGARGHQLLNTFSEACHRVHSVEQMLYIFSTGKEGGVPQGERYATLFPIPPKLGGAGPAV